MKQSALASKTKQRLDTHEFQHLFKRELFRGPREVVHPIHVALPIPGQAFNARFSQPPRQDLSDRHGILIISLGNPVDKGPSAPLILRSTGVFCSRIDWAFAHLEAEAAA